MALVTQVSATWRASPHQPQITARSAFPHRPPVWIQATMSYKVTDGKVQEEQQHVVVDIEEPRYNKDTSTCAVDADLLHRTVEDAGRWAFGTVFVELWVLNDDKTNLIRPESGWWIDPAFYSFKASDGEKLIREPEPLAPGVGLAGVLWSDAVVTIKNTANIGGMTKKLMKTSTKGAKQSNGPVAGTRTVDPRRVVWREIEAIATDPMQAQNARLQRIAECGLGLAAAVPFHFNSRKGIVVYMARKNASPKKLQSATNEAYLVGAADLIGAAWALRVPRRAVVTERHNEFKRVVRLVTARIHESKRKGIDLASLVDENISKSPEKEPLDPLEDIQPQSCGEVSREAVNGAVGKVFAASKKVRGGKSNPPLLFDWYQTGYTFFGVFVSLLTLTQFNKHVGTVHGSDYTLIMAPLAAVLTLLYALTAAPPSQPRQVLTAQALGMIIALLFQEIPETRMDTYMRQSLASSIAIALMVKLGITHPPAAALTFVFASNVGLGFGNMAFILLGDVIMISIAAIILNLNEKRQYPTFWGIGFIGACFRRDYVTEEDDY